ncbi:hypothetical protein [Nostoc linckia]|uniref:hypothetical protein n=1 Tax=Nostoc linckia TaxID=92942 RepID=UPI0015D4E0E5|nr:hypothetical protein [Nostoc linckia]
MATEVLNIPEEYLEQVILVIRRGIQKSEECGGVQQEVIEQLKKWCDEEEAYLQEEG